MEISGTLSMEHLHTLLPYDAHKGQWFDPMNIWRSYKMSYVGTFFLFSQRQITPCQRTLVMPRLVALSTIVS